MKDKHPTTGPPLGQSLQETIPFFEPEPLTPEKEDLILQSVEHDLFAQLRRESKSAPQPVRRWNWALLTGLSGAMAAAAFLMVVWIWPDAPPPLQLSSMVAVHDASSPTSSDTVSLKARPNQPGEITSPKRWKIKTSPGAFLALQRRGSSQTHVKLHQGFVQVSVTPNTMKQFAVQTGPIRTLVRGTVFTVERGKTWVRVEVRHGKVEVQGHGKTYKLKAGQGLRLSLRKKQEKLHRYSAPKQENMTLAQQLEWLKTNAPDELPQKARDLVHSNQLSLQQRWQLLMSLVDHLQGRRKYKQQYLLLQKILELPLKKFQRRSAMLEAAKACHRWDRKALECVPVYKAFLKAYPKDDIAKYIETYLKKTLSKP
ncbi:MAG: hypothetical protein EP343_07435 [Deltaproteobacteria bacterium]|nr:MAG: hypothetical protein EP343_07435 [Deltaproteobacteria bacterium]